MTDTKKDGRRGRPRAFDEATALATAQRLFEEKGYDGAGVAELAASMRVNPPSLYAAFGSKDRLFARALARYSSTKSGFIESALPAPDLPAVARALLRGGARAYAARNGVAGCLAIETARGPGDGAAAAAARAQLEEMRAKLVDRIAAEAPADLETLADQLVVALTGLSALARVGASASRLDRAAARIAEGFIATLAASDRELRASRAEPDRAGGGRRRRS